MTHIATPITFMSCVCDEDDTLGRITPLTPPHTCHPHTHNHTSHPHTPWYPRIKPQAAPGKKTAHQKTAVSSSKNSLHTLSTLITTSETCVTPFLSNVCHPFEIHRSKCQPPWRWSLLLPPFPLPPFPLPPCTIYPQNPSLPFWNRFVLKAWIVQLTEWYASDLYGNCSRIDLKLRLGPLFCQFEVPGETTEVCRHHEYLN